MASVNKVILIGNVGRDPEIKRMNDGNPICNLSVATTRSYKDKSGAYQKETEWHRVSLFGKLADICERYVKRGHPLYIEGHLRTRKYTGRDGIERLQTEILADQIQLLTKPQADEQQSTYTPQREAPAPAAKPAALTSPSPFMNDDVPF